MYSVECRRIENVLSRSDNVVAAWLFGSAQGGQVRPGGDLDIAVLFDEMPSLDERADLRAELQQALQFDEIDLLVLNAASPITRFEAVRGRPVFCRDAGRRAGFVSLTAREYEDAMGLLRRAMAYRERTGS